MEDEKKKELSSKLNWKVHNMLMAGAITNEEAIELGYSRKKVLMEDIFSKISNTYPYSQEEIKRLYSSCEDIDLMIDALEKAMETGESAYTIIDRLADEYKSRVSQAAQKTISWSSDSES